MNRHVLCSTALRSVVLPLMLGAFALQAAPISVPAQQSLSTAPGGGLTQVNYSKLSIDISVSPVDTLLLYEYVVTYGPGKSKDNQDISHMIINLSNAVIGGLPACSTTNGCFDLIGINGAEADSISLGTYSATSQGSSNPGLPASVYGVKFDFDDDEFSTADGVTSFTIAFLSNRVPVYGTIYGKSGHGYFYSTQAIVPDTMIYEPPSDDPAIPEPGTYAMLGAGLLTLGFLRRRR